SANKLFKQNLP
ncbi:unnamed protein product, partial [Rotaria sp. Silwood1]